MYPPKFDYFRADSVNDALSLMRSHPGAKYLAGGHSIIPILNLRLDDPGVLIDIGRISELKDLFVDRGAGNQIGSLNTHAEIAVNRDVPFGLSEAAGMIGDPQVRNRGTVGGNVAHADPASDLPTVFTALNASFQISGLHGQREVEVADFFKGMFHTALEEGDIIRRIRVPSLSTSRTLNEVAGSAYVKLANPASRYAMVGAAAVVAKEGGKASHVAVAIGGLTPKPMRAHSVEAALLGKPLDADTIATAAAAVQDDLGDEILGDIHASAAYRRSMATVMVRRALTKAAERAP
jgi:carbon-monoxide dehydrogenase medium subunit